MKSIFLSYRDDEEEEEEQNKQTEENLLALTPDMVSAEFPKIEESHTQEYTEDR